MSYTLNSNDRRILQQTINTVNNLPVNPKGGKRPTIKTAFAYAELTAQDANGLWSAFEVYFDETGTPNELTDGRVWGLEIPSIIVNGTVSAGTVIRVERYYYVDSSNDEQPIWIGSAVGGGGSEVGRLQCISDVTLALNSVSTNFNLVDDLNNIITQNVTVSQGRFTDGAFVYEGEIIYGLVNNGAYKLDPFIFGVGG